MLTELGMLQLYFHTNYIYIIHLIFAHGPADDDCNTIASHLFLCLSLADLPAPQQQTDPVIPPKATQTFQEARKNYQEIKSMYEIQLQL